MPSFLRASSLAVARPALRAPRARAFSTFPRRGLKESDLGNPDRATQSEIAKQDTLKKQKEGKGHWKPELASESEEAVAADRHTTGKTKESLEELQKRTVQHAHKKNEHGTSQDPGM